MVWNSLWPDGSKSVAQNTPTGQQNTTYIESIMGNGTNTSKDHFWNIGTDEDGHHRAVQMENYSDTYTGAPSDLVLSSGMDGGIYLKTINGTIQGFYINTVGIYQFIPGFLTGSFTYSGTGFQNIVAVPDSCYGEIVLFKADALSNLSTGVFKASGGVTQANTTSAPEVNSTSFGNTGNSGASGLNIRVVILPGTYQYRVTYRAI